MAGAIRIGSTWRHKKRGTLYEFVGLAGLQIATHPELEKQSYAVYRGEDDELWVRPEAEFLDGRFEEMS